MDPTGGYDMSSIRESLRMAFDGLFNNKVRSLLTMLGIIIGVGAVIAMVSLGQGFSSYVTNQFESLGTNLLTVMRERSVDGALDLTVSDAEALEGLPGVAAVAPTYRGSATVLNDEGVESSDTDVSGVTPAYETARNYEMKVGRFIEDSDTARRSKVAVLGHTTAETLFPNNAYPIGSVVRLDGVPFEVIGVMVEKGGSGFMDPDDVVLIPLTTAQTRLFDVSTYRGQYVLSMIEVQGTSEEETDMAQENVSRVLREKHRLGDADPNDFRIMSQTDMIETASSVLGTMTLFLSAVAAISLVVGGIGIMNIMLVSVTERTREIGLRKAIGAGRRDILLQFLIEAMGLSFTGGLIGIGLGVLLSRVVGPQVGVTPLTQPLIMVIAAGFSAMVGVIFGMYPAMRASGLQPVEALRYE
jgi:putative ABC transport system permease protein